MFTRNATTITKALGFTLFLGLAAGSAQAQTLISGKNVTFPINITKSGSYKLTSNLNVPAGLSGIVLAAGVDATIDLNNFTITGAAECSPWVECYEGSNGTVGVRVQSDQTLRVFNGTVRGFTAAGVGDPTGFGETLVIARDLRVERNAIGLRANGIMAENVMALYNQGTGIYGDTGTVVDSIANGNSVGVSISMGSIRGCVARANITAGFSFQRTTHQDNVTFDNGVQTQNGGPYSPGLNNGFLD